MNFERRRYPPVATLVLAFSIFSLSLLALSTAEAAAATPPPPPPPPPPAAAKSGWLGNLLGSGNDKSANAGKGGGDDTVAGGDGKGDFTRPPPHLPSQHHGGGWFAGGPPPPPMPFIPPTQHTGNDEEAKESTNEGEQNAMGKRGGEPMNSGENIPTMPPPPPPLPLPAGGQYEYWGNNPGAFGMPPPLPQHHQQQQQQQQWGQTQQAQYEDWETVDPFVALQSKLEAATGRESELLYQVSNLTASRDRAQNVASGRLHTIDVLTERISETEARAASESNAALELRANCTKLANTVQQLQKEASAREERCTVLEELKVCDDKLVEELRDEIRKKQSELEDLACAIEEDRVDAERERYLEEIRQRRKKRGFFGAIFGAIFGKGYDEEEERAKAQELARSTLIHALQVERSNVDELEASLLILQQNNSAISDMVESRDHLINELNDRVSVFEEDKIVLKAALRQLQKEMKEEAPKTQKVVSHLKKAQEEIKHLHDAAKEAKAKHSEQVEKLSAQIRSRDKQIKESESKMSTIAHYVDQLEERLASFAIARKEIGVREEKCKGLEEKDEQQREEMAALQTQVNDLTRERDEMKSLIDLLVEERGVLQQDKAKLEKKIRKFIEESNLLKRRFAEKEEEVAKVDRDINETNQKLNEAEQTIEELEGAVASVSNQLAEVERIADENRVEAAEKITRADEISLQQQQKIEELFARVAAAEAPPPPPPLPVLVNDDAALDETAVVEQTNADVSGSSPPPSSAATERNALPSDIEGVPSYSEPEADGSGTIFGDLNAEHYNSPEHDDTVVAVGGSEPGPSIEEVGCDDGEESQHSNEVMDALAGTPTESSKSETSVLINQDDIYFDAKEYHDNPGTVDVDDNVIEGDKNVAEESSTSDVPSRTSGDDDFFDAVQDDNDDMALVSGARGGSEETVVPEGVQVAEAILGRFDDGGGIDSGDDGVPPYPLEDSLVEGVMRFRDKGEEVGSDLKDEEVDGELAIASIPTLEEESPPSLPTSGQPSQSDHVSIPPAPRRNVPLRKLRKVLSKATGMHGVFTPSSRPRGVPPPKGGKASFGLKAKHPPTKKDQKY